MTSTDRLLPLVCALACALCALSAEDAAAGRILMKNGDRITGTIKQIWDGELTIDPDYGSEFTVQMTEIVSLESEREFEIEFADGQSTTAVFDGADDAGRVRLVVEGERQARALDEVAELREIEAFYDWNSRVDLKSSVYRGNTESTTLRLDGQTRLKLGDHEHLASVTIARESFSGQTTKEQLLGTYGYSWSFREHVFLGANLNLERDPIRNLQRRYNAGAGVGWEIWDDAGRSFRIQGGLGFQTEDIGGLATSNAITYWSLRVAHDVLGDAVNLFHNQTISANLGARQNTVLKTQTGARYEISDLLYANVEIDFDRESNPANEALREDLAILFGLGLEF